MFLLIALYVFSALSFTLAKAALLFGKPIFFIGFRMVIAGALLMGYCWFRKDKLFQLNWRADWKWFLLASMVHIYAAFIPDIIALNYMTSFKGALIYTLSPFIAALFSYIFFHEKMNFLKTVGLMIGFAGVLPVLLMQEQQESSLTSFLNISWPELMMIGSVVASVWGWTIVRHLVKKGYSTITINGISKFGGGILALITSVCIEGWGAPVVNNWIDFLYITILIIIVVNLLFYNLYGYLLRYYTATFLAFAGFLSPIFTAIFGWLWLGETVHWSFFISIITIVVGLAIFYCEELKQGYTRHNSAI